MTLTEFLLARIAEDETLARESHYEGQAWLPEEEAVVRAADWEPIFYADRKRDAQHIANWSPARVLAECEAKRRMVEVGGAAIRQANANYNDEWETGIGSGWEAALTFLALPYADHPDYRQEWKP